LQIQHPSNINDALLTC